ncbi:ribosome silencing factor [Leptolyngbya sp. 'hensonii']|uniref:ribosome silencing factor n=1 Tax=Leptolyngbya sp. 'hensonii' TaxID=1922337 RepID=UPI00094F5B50|nr:ribosome silencing factor [Leptolyngbya sp. 'hensonii']OLP20299.1 ribosome silencing factor [Leptolyngbya sp. 'hensonii']
MPDYTHSTPLAPSTVSTAVQTERSSPDQTRELALTIARAAEDRKGAEITILRVEEISYLADYFVIATGFSNVQVRAISRSIQDKVEEEWQRYPIRVEGLSEGNWVLQDYGEIIVHIFMPQEREFYNLEAFWGHAERIDFSPYPSMK